MEYWVPRVRNLLPPGTASSHLAVFPQKTARSLRLPGGMENIPPLPGRRSSEVGILSPIWEYLRMATQAVNIKINLKTWRSTCHCVIPDFDWCGLGNAGNIRLPLGILW